MEKNIRLFFLLIFLFICVEVNAQGLAAYSDYQNHFIIFDNGGTQQYEYLPVKSFKTGKTCIAYIDNNDNLKVYFKGKLTTLSTLGGDYFVTDNLVLSKVADQLKVFENGKTTILTTNAGSFLCSDSLVAFHDNLLRKFRVYYNGAITDLEDVMMDNTVKRFNLAYNMLVYVNKQRYVKIFYRGQTVHFPSGTISDFRVGENIIAYFDQSLLSFNIWYKNEVIQVDNYQPGTYKASRDIMAWVDQTGRFRIFDQGEIYEISDFTPEFYSVKDHLVIFSEQGYFKVYSGGQVYELENFIPVQYEASDQWLAYKDYQGWLKLFNGRETQIISREQVKEFYINYNTLYFKSGLNTNQVFFNDKIY